MIGLKISLMKLGRTLTGAEIIPILQDLENRTITIKDLIDKILLYQPIEGSFLMKPSIGPLVQKNKEEICRLRGLLLTTSNKANAAIELSNKAWQNSKENEMLIQEALASARHAELDILQYRGVKESVNELKDKVQGLEVNIVEEVSGDNQYYLYKFYQGNDLITTIRIPTNLEYVGSKYIGINSNSIYLKEGLFDTDYLEPIRNSKQDKLTPGNLIKIDDNVIGVDLDLYYDT